MPYKSLKQERFFNANRAKLERKGVNVAEWNRASKGKKLPKVSKKVVKDNKRAKVMHKGKKVYG